MKQPRSPKHVQTYEETENSNDNHDETMNIPMKRLKAVLDNIENDDEDSDGEINDEGEEHKMILHEVAKEKSDTEVSFIFCNAMSPDDAVTISSFLKRLRALAKGRGAGNGNGGALSEAGASEAKVVSMNVDEVS